MAARVRGRGGGVGRGWRRLTRGESGIRRITRFAVDDLPAKIAGQVPTEGEAAFRADAGVSATPGEAGYSLIERLWGRPTLDCNGIWGGFQGEGAKTVIPATAGAKLSCRLVPGQDPDDISDKLARYLESLAPDGVEVSVRRLHGGRPASTPLDARSVRAAAQALRATFGREPVFARTGGTIPVVADFQELLGCEVVLVGFGLEDDRAHAPNEKLAVRDYLRGIATSARLLRALAGSGA